MSSLEIVLNAKATRGLHLRLAELPGLSPAAREDVNAVPRDGLTGGSNFEQAVQTTGGVFFLGQDIDHGIEAWVTDGTPAGTRLLKDIFPGPSSSDIDMRHPG